MNKVRLKSWEAARAELQKVAGEEVCGEYDRHLAEGRKVSAIKLLRENGISLETES